MLRTSTHGPITRLRLSRTWRGRPLHEVSAYLVGDLLIDTGPPATAGEVVEFCRRHRVRRVVNTHHHEDHVGGDARLAAELGLDIRAPAGSLPILAAWRPVPAYRRLVWGQPADCRPRDLAPLDDVVEVGGYRFRVLPTPGHAFDHVCLFEESRGWLFSGDLYVHPRVQYSRRIEDLSVHLESLRRMLALGPELLVCSHAGLVPDARGALARKIAWWEALGRRARELSDAGLSERAATRRLLGRDGPLALLSLGDFSKRNTVRGLLAVGG